MIRVQVQRQRSSTRDLEHDQALNTQADRDLARARRVRDRANTRRFSTEERKHHE